MPKRGNNRGVWEGKIQDQVSRLTEHNKSPVDGDTSKSLKGFIFRRKIVSGLPRYEIVKNYTQWCGKVD